MKDNLNFVANYGGLYYPIAAIFLKNALKKIYSWTIIGESGDIINAIKNHNSTKYDVKLLFEDYF